MTSECKICGATWETLDYDFGPCPGCNFDPERAVRSAAEPEPVTEVWYLASPYTHADPAVRRDRVYQTARIAARLADQGIYTIPAVVIGAGLADAVPDLGTAWSDWKAYDEALMSACKGVIVCRIQGWQESAGVRAEIAWAEAHGLSVSYVDEDKDICD